MFESKRFISALACRVCLSIDNATKVIMDDDNGWLALFEFCFGLQINQLDKAKTLCGTCADNIKTFSNFKKKCLQSHNLWNSNILRTQDVKVKLIKIKDAITAKTENEGDSTNNIHLEENIYQDILETTDNVDFSFESEKYNSSKSIIENTDYSDYKAENLDYSDRSDDSIYTKNKKRHNNETCKLNSINKKPKLHWQSCGLCTFSTQELNTLWKHLDEHYSRNDLECKLCDYTARDFAEMVSHRYSHETSIKRLQCPKCQKCFFSHIKLQFHFRSVHLNEKGGRCFYCNAQFSNVKTWQCHETKFHSNETSNGEKRKLLICDCCGLKFAYRHTIKIHLRLRAGLSKVICDKCGAVFSRKQNLTAHIQNKHTNPVMVKCPTCHKSVRKYILETHIKRIHGEKKYKCEVCPESFTNKINLKYHILTHTKERPYKCSICDATYKSNSLKNIHMRKHTGVKPYECSTCFKAFFTMIQLKRHGAVHTNVRTVKCGECNRSFHYKKSLLEHQAKAHSKL